MSISQVQTVDTTRLNHLILEQSRNDVSSKTGVDSTTTLAILSLQQTSLTPLLLSLQMTDLQNVASQITPLVQEDKVAKILLDDLLIKEKKLSPKEKSITLSLSICYFCFIIIEPIFKTDSYDLLWEEIYENLKEIAKQYLLKSVDFDTFLSKANYVFELQKFLEELQQIYQEALVTEKDLGKSDDNTVLRFNTLKMKLESLCKQQDEFNDLFTNKALTLEETINTSHLVLKDQLQKISTLGVVLTGEMNKQASVLDETLSAVNKAKK